MTGKLTAEELAEARNIWDIMHSNARMIISLQTPESITDSWNALMRRLGNKYNFDPMQTSINLQTGEINT